jgi:hypothetical protein
MMKFAYRSLFAGLAGAALLTGCAADEAAIAAGAPDLSPMSESGGYGGSPGTGGAGAGTTSGMGGSGAFGMGGSGTTSSMGGSGAFGMGGSGTTSGMGGSGTTSGMGGSGAFGMGGSGTTSSMGGSTSVGAGGDPSGSGGSGGGDTGGCETGGTEECPECWDNTCWGGEVDQEWEPEEDWGEGGGGGGYGGGGGAGGDTLAKKKGRQIGKAYLEGAPAECTPTTAEASADGCEHADCTTAKKAAAKKLLDALPANCKQHSNKIKTNKPCKKIDC